MQNSQSFLDFVNTVQHYSHDMHVIHANKPLSSPKHHGVSDPVAGNIRGGDQAKP